MAAIEGHIFIVPQIIHSFIGDQLSFESLSWTDQSPRIIGIKDRILGFKGRALTADDLSDLLMLSRDTNYKQARSGSNPSFRAGTAVRFEALIEWLERQ